MNDGIHISKVVEHCSNGALKIAREHRSSIGFIENRHDDEIHSSRYIYPDIQNIEWTGYTPYNSMGYNQRELTIRFCPHVVIQGGINVVFLDNQKPKVYIRSGGMNQSVISDREMIAHAKRVLGRNYDFVLVMNVRLTPARSRDYWTIGYDYELPFIYRY